MRSVTRESPVHAAPAPEIMDKEDFYALKIMGEIERDDSPSQRELSRRLNISLGLVNTFLKRLVEKGYFKVKTMPRNRVKYFLTPKGLARKSKLTVEYLKYSVDFYGEIKKLLLERYGAMERCGIRSVVFYGAGEVAELAYLYLQLTGLRLAGIVDPEQEGKAFFQRSTKAPGWLAGSDWDAVLITRLDDPVRDIKRLTSEGIERDRIFTL